MRPEHAAGLMLAGSFVVVVALVVLWDRKHWRRDR